MRRKRISVVLVLADGREVAVEVPPTALPRTRARSTRYRVT
jgi:hypothetical protein